jgi:hypothetical protein
MMSRDTPTATGLAGCGACGYSTIGLTTLTCPECGADFRAVGIAGLHDGAGRRRRRVGRRLFDFVFAGALILLALWGLQAALLGTLLGVLVPPIRFEHAYEGTSRADPGRSWKVHSTGRFWAGALPLAPPVTIELSVSPAAGTMRRYTLTYDPSTNGYRYEHDGVATSGRDFGPDVVLRWMDATSATDPRLPTDPAPRREAARVAGLARRIGRNARINDADELYARLGRGSFGGGGADNLFTATKTSTWIRDNAPHPRVKIVNGIRLVLSLGLLWVLFRAMVLPRRPAATPFTPHAAAE